VRSSNGDPQRGRISETTVIVLAAILGAAGALGGSYVGGRMALTAADRQADASVEVARRAEVERVLREFTLAIDQGLEFAHRMESVPDPEDDRAAFDAEVAEIRSSIPGISRRLEDAYLSVQLVAPSDALDAARDTHDEYVAMLNIMNDMLDIRAVAQFPGQSQQPANPFDELSPTERTLTEKRDVMVAVFREVLGDS
jgi:hypothetical protein